ncbi:MAG: DUF2188 domain-containing protein [Bacteroidota bacterium]|nr:DUF2188 domain-containing protein [Bacteroidota bacterium]MDE2835417.1 DUF2188 domain-containing protein [Bacteroidota bacterium]MDE2955775.1 DUF2188 domain-containing protein [Bacteroidota bacterium]
MSKKQDRTISPRKNGKWANKRNNSGKAASLHDTQAEAIEAGRENVKNQGGGELTIQGKDGKIRRKITIPPGRDPFPPRG